VIADHIDAIADQVSGTILMERGTAAAVRRTISPVR
jgi:hypothetical protein